MNIDRIETVRHEDHPNLLFVLVTSQGVTGLGETFYAAGPVESYVHEVVAPLLLGTDPLRITAHNRVLEGYVGYAGSGVETRARSAIDIALWDLRGQISGLTLADAMGGRTRDAIRAYNTCAGPRYVRGHGQSTSNWGVSGEHGGLEDLARFLDDAGALAEELLSEGLTGMKIWPFDPFAELSAGTYLGPDDLRTAIEPLRQVRAAVGDAIDLMVELHGLWNVPMARHIIRALEPVAPFWVEDPVRADGIGGLAEVAQAAADAGTMVAAGETVAQTTGFLPLLAAGAIDVVTVDLAWCGGITQALRVAAVAESYGRAIAPHDCTGPVSLVAATHLSLSAPNALAQETVRASLRTWYGEFVTELPIIENGMIRPPSGPGLGTRLQPDLLKRGARSRVSR